MARLRVGRWVAAAAGALAMPFPGPHVDTYVPLGWVLLRAPGEGADAGVWALVGAILAGYTLLCRAVIAGALFTAAALRPRGQ